MQHPVFDLVHSKTAYERYTDEICVHRVHTSDILMSYGWHTSIYEWHADDIQVDWNV